MEKVNKGKVFQVINFNEAYEPPKNTINKAGKFVKWGDKNDYPNYLINLYNYNGSSRHSSIINKKVTLTSGQGLFADTPEIQEFITKMGLDNECKKATYDYELFNGFAFEIVWNNGGTALTSFKHIPISSLRFGLKEDDKEESYFWFSKDWTQIKKYPAERINAYNPEIKAGKQIFYFSEYNPSHTLVNYPIPNYSTCINSIETDYQISRFHLNQAKQGYAPSFILNFATGIPTVEEQEELYDDFQAQYSGTENAGKVIITYSEGEDQKPTFQKIDLNTSDTRFIQLQARIENDIVQGSQAPAQLFMLVAGKLGSTQERNELLTEFQKSYISPRQLQLEKVINQILSNTELKGSVRLKKYQE